MTILNIIFKNGDFTPTNDMVKAGLWTIAGVAALDGGGEDPGE